MLVGIDCCVHLVCDKLNWNWNATGKDRRVFNTTQVVGVIVLLGDQMVGATCRVTYDFIAEN